MKKFLATLLAMTMTLSLAACGGGNDAPAEDNPSDSAEGGEVVSVEGKTVAFIPKLTGNAFFEVANEGAQEYAKDWGITVEYMGNAVAGVAEQVAVVNQAVASGVDAICISTVDAAGVADALQAAMDAGIAVCT